jgi:hypothetical protein
MRLTILIIPIAQCWFPISINKLERDYLQNKKHMYSCYEMQIALLFVVYTKHTEDASPTSKVTSSCGGVGR